MALKGEVAKGAVFKLVRFCLVNFLKLSGWHLYIAMHVLDVLWISVVYPFIKSEVRVHKMKKSAIKKKNVLAQVKKMDGKRGFREQSRAMWRALREGA